MMLARSNNYGGHEKFLECTRKVFEKLPTVAVMRTKLQFVQKGVVTSALPTDQLAELELRVRMKASAVGKTKNYLHADFFLIKNY